MRPPPICAIALRLPVQWTSYRIVNHSLAVFDMAWSFSTIDIQKHWLALSEPALRAKVLASAERFPLV
jgi:hypothetical protein